MKDCTDIHWEVTARELIYLRAKAKFINLYNEDFWRDLSEQDKANIFLDECRLYFQNNTGY